MSCNSPIPAWYADKLTESGKRPLTFSGRDRYQGFDDAYLGFLDIPCGKCAGCRADQSLSWALRCYHEASQYDRNCFITLTYSDDHLPSDGKICVEHLQKFFRRMRKAGLFVRYFACAEYGGLTNRPHYHAILFGVDFLGNALPLSDKLYTNVDAVNFWRLGHVAIAPVEMASICYVCGYAQKKINDVDTFTCMSRRPGIGHNWLDAYSDDIVRTGTVSIEGREYQVPKRYLIWNESCFADIRAARREHAKKISAAVSPLDRAQQLKNREINRRSRIKSRESKESI